MKYIDIPHIGEILIEEFWEPLNLSRNALARAIGVPSNRINAIIPFNYKIDKKIAM